jgi:ferrochelatase
VVLCNLGTPDEPTAPAVRRYLAEFLGDHRVVEIPKPIWWLILHGIILRVRPAKSAAKYASVWTPEGSPLKVWTDKQATLLRGYLGERGHQVTVRYAMRYGNPSIESRMTALMADGCDRILIAPMYPQYCAATTATVFDEVARVLGAMRWQPALRFVPPYHDNPGYIGALADDLARQVHSLAFTPEVMLLSFHGMPQQTLQKGDPYYCHCMKTARLLREELAKRPAFAGVRFETTFQSRFGPAAWLEPSTDASLLAEGDKGTKRLVVAAPGFAADCVETLEELALEGRDEFTEHGGEDYAVLDCLNTSGHGLEMIDAMLRRELSGWI